jgi:hypothetical protein
MSQILQNNIGNEEKIISSTSHTHFTSPLTPMQFLSYFLLNKLQKISFRSRLSITKTGNSFGGRNINENMGMKTVKKRDQP